MKKTDIWMPLYVADYLADTTRLTTEQHGAYLLLIMDYWRNGPLPDDDSALAQVTRLTLPAWKKNRNALARMFQVSEGEWRHKRIDAEFSNASDNSEKKSAAGKLGSKSKWGLADDSIKATRSARLEAARAKGTHTPDEWRALVDVCGSQCVKCGSEESIVKDHIIPIYQGGSDAIENLQPMCRHCNASKGSETTDLRPTEWKEMTVERLAKRLANVCQTPNPSPSPSEVNISGDKSPSGSRAAKSDLRFEDFWSAWPRSKRKDAKTKCREKWKRMGLDAIADRIVAHVEAAKKSTQWIAGYEPAPLRYLSEERWDNDALVADGYSEQSLEVMAAYGEILGATGWPEVATDVYSEDRESQIAKFMTLSNKDEWVARYFEWLRDNLEARVGYGFDWVIQTETFIRAREGNFASLKEAA